MERLVYPSPLDRVIRNLVSFFFIPRFPLRSELQQLYRCRLWLVSPCNRLLPPLTVQQGFTPPAFNHISNPNSRPRHARVPILQRDKLHGKGRTLGTQVPARVRSEGQRMNVKQPAGFSQREKRCVQYGNEC